MVSVTVVMYHYIRDSEKTEYPGIHAISVDKFKEHIAKLKQEGNKFIHLDDYYEYLVNGKSIPEKSCILTFDDGVKEHYSTVYPILKEENIPGVFYIMTEPLADKKVPIVQKIHFLLSKIDSETFSNDVNLQLKDKYENLFEEFEIHGRFKINPKKRFDDNLTANLKHNIAKMPAEMKKDIVNIIFNKHFSDEESFCEELYANFEELKEMENGGMILGCHSHSHPLLTSLSYDEQKKEIEKSTNILEENLKIKMKHFAYPYGDFNEDTIKILKDLNYTTVVTVKADINKEKIDPFYISRINANDV